MAKILIVDDEEGMRWALSRIVREEGYEALTAGNGKESLKMVAEEEPDLVFMDIKMPVMNGLDALERIRRTNKEIVVVVLTAYDDAKFISRAIGLGAYDYLVKSIDIDKVQIKNVIRQALRAKELMSKEVRYRFEGIIGKSQPMLEILELLRKIGHSDITVLVEGESGTGKELVAQAIHTNSLRCNQPFVTVDCGTLPETLTESEIFGYEAGAFTDAKKSKPGKFELADKGTLFLDEIGNLSPPAQAKLLRALEDRKIARLGGNEVVDVNVRIIAATNMNLEEECLKKRFREDLYYRLNVFKIVIPPLRKKREDIPLLADYFLRLFQEREGRKIDGFSDEAMNMLMAHSWHGNVRELRNVLERAVLLADDVILAEHLPTDFGKERKAPPAEPVAEEASAASPAEEAEAGMEEERPVYEAVPLKEAKKRAVEEVEKEYILKALEDTNWNRTEAAKLLDLNYKTLREKIKEYNLEKPRRR